ncbi:MAG: VTT domain-containing protein [Patescibacteria group bacterium]
MPEFLQINEILAYGYIGIIIVIFLESGIFFPLPGDSLLFAAGLFASGDKMNVYLLVGLVVTASFTGILAGYHIGSHLEKWRHRAFYKRFIKDEYLNKASEFFFKHGKKTIILSRFVPIVRTFAPIVAGAVKMEYRAFIRASVLGSVIWAGLFIFGGYFLGKFFPEAKEYVLWIVALIILASFFPALPRLFKRAPREDNP